MGKALLCATAAIIPPAIEQMGVYIAGCWTTLGEDKKLVIAAAGAWAIGSMASPPPGVVT